MALATQRPSQQTIEEIVCRSFRLNEFDRKCHQREQDFMAALFPRQKLHSDRAKMADNPNSSKPAGKRTSFCVTPNVTSDPNSGTLCYTLLSDRGLTDLIFRHFSIQRHPRPLQFFGGFTLIPIGRGQGRNEALPFICKDVIRGILLAYVFR
jgi:hypothetical protein